MNDLKNSQVLIYFSTIIDKEFLNGSPDNVKINEIITYINGTDSKGKKIFKPLAKLIAEKAFHHGINYSNLNVDDFDEPIIDEQKSLTNKADSKQLFVVEEKLEVQKQIDFESTFEYFVNCFSSSKDVYKGYSLFKLENDNKESFELLVIYDETYLIEPVKQLFQNKKNYNINFYSLEIFKDKIIESDFNHKNYLCLLLLNSRHNDKHEESKLKDFLKDLKNQFKIFVGISNTSVPGNVSFLPTYDSDDIIEEVLSSSCTFLSNGSINDEEEKVIKKLCHKFKTPLIVYKILKNGNSGAKVIEIRPRKKHDQDIKRYIIKYSKRTEVNKLHQEWENFCEAVEGYKKTVGYECFYEKTASYEGIMYKYAINDNEEVSYPFSQILGDEENTFYDSLNNIIEDLFKIDLYGTWQKSLNEKTISTQELYHNYLKIDATRRTVKKLLNIKEEDIEDNQLIKNTSKILAYTRKFNLKLCHGDLHTDNFFKDKEGIYLIDFGFTGMCHSAIDHASLECSIKFNHIPRYITIDDLIKLEQYFLTDDSFQKSYAFPHGLREDLKPYFEIIKSIRNSAYNYLSIDTTEYFISLFVMSLKQMRYDDLNQLYAYHSALILSNHIITIIELI